MAEILVCFGSFSSCVDASKKLLFLFKLFGSVDDKRLAGRYLQVDHDNMGVVFSDYTILQENSRCGATIIEGTVTKFNRLAFTKASKG